MVEKDVEDDFYKLGWHALPFRRSKYSCLSFVHEVGSELAETVDPVKVRSEHLAKMGGEESRSVFMQIYKRTQNWGHTCSKFRASYRP